MGEALESTPPPAQLSPGISSPVLANITSIPGFTRSPHWNGKQTMENSSNPGIIIRGDYGGIIQTGIPERKGLTVSTPYYKLILIKTNL
jgi:hypothetical protein